MFQYEFEKRPPSSCDSRATMTTEYTQSFPSRAPSRAPSRVCPSVERARRPLPPRPMDFERLPTKTSVPLKVWVIASASCFAVCGILVLATVVITKWGTSNSYDTHRHELFAQIQEPIYPVDNDIQMKTTTTEDGVLTTEDDMQFLEKLSIFKNIVANRDKNKRLTKTDLISKPQFHPVHDAVHHEDRKIEKKDRPKIPDSENADSINSIPNFKPTLPDVFFNTQSEIKLPDGYVAGLKKYELDYEEYYNDENLYDDYMQSNSITNYLIEKVQELHDWITSDPDFETNNATKKSSGNDFGQLLKALNESLIEGNVTIVMNKLRDIYFGDVNWTTGSKRNLVSNSSNLLSFGILTLDVMLLHNIQLMAWENQELARTKMLKDPDVFAFNALFLDPTKVEAKQNQILHHYDNSGFSKRQNLRMENLEFFDIGRNLLDNIIELGVSTARAAIHLGRAYKNTKVVLNQITNREVLNANIQSQISRNIDANTHALNHLQMTYNSSSHGSYTELDCVWLLYCKNLVATSKLNAPYGTMARINGIALRMLTGELSADKALDTMLYEAISGWTELRCNDMFPKCNKADAASIVVESILQPIRKSHLSSRAR